MRQHQHLAQCLAREKCSDNNSQSHSDSASTAILTHEEITTWSHSVPPSQGVRVPLLFIPCKQFKYPALNPERCQGRRADYFPASDKWASTLREKRVQLPSNSTLFLNLKTEGPSSALCSEHSWPLCAFLPIWPFLPSPPAPVQCPVWGSRKPHSAAHHLKVACSFLKSLALPH